MNNLDDVSLVIATYNERNPYSMFWMNENYNLGEIIIVDGGSTDKTKQLSNRTD